jgi:hypothetical protein
MGTEGRRAVADFEAWLATIPITPTDPQARRLRSAESRDARQLFDESPRRSLGGRRQGVRQSDSDLQGL